MSEDKANARKLHVEALQTELEHLQARPVSDTRDRRIGEVQAEIKKFSSAPPRGQRETAADPK